VLRDVLGCVLQGVCCRVCVAVAVCVVGVLQDVLAVLVGGCVAVCQLGGR